MNVFEMLSFDFQEFVTSPAGILIIVGIVCLLVGIVIFLKEGKKTKAPTEEVKEEAKPAEAAPAVEEKKEEAAPVVEAAPAVEPVVVKATEDGVSEVPVPEVAETLNITEATPVVAPVEEVKTESLDAPTVEPAAPVVEAPAVAPVAPVVEAPAVESLDDAQPVVYGGASPEVKDVVVEEQPREIYGGANPLENTAPIPTAEVNAAAPVVSPAPEAAPVVEAPEAPAAPAAPAAPEAPKEEIEKLEF